MKDCMMMQALINKEKLFVPGAAKGQRRYEHLECGETAGTASFRENSLHAPPRPVVYELWQII